MHFNNGTKRTSLVEHIESKPRGIISNYNNDVAHRFRSNDNLVCDV